MTALRAAADIVALLTYASIIRRNRKPKSGLGANLPVVVAAAFASALIREVPIVALQPRLPQRNRSTSAPSGSRRSWAP